MNWKSEAIDRLHDYPAMVRATVTLPREIDRLERESTALPAVRADKVRVMTSKQRMEDGMLCNLIRRQELSRNLENVVRWVDNTDYALSVLTPEEKTVLLRMYVLPEKGAVGKLCEELCVEQSSVYRKRDSALYRFTMALYGAN